MGEEAPCLCPLSYNVVSSPEHPHFPHFPRDQNPKKPDVVLQLLHPPPLLSPSPLTQTSSHLELLSSLLASLQLLQVPIADGHIAAVLIHALGELLGRLGAVAAQGLLLLGGSRIGLRRVGSRLAGAAAEEGRDAVADDVPDRGADGDAALARFSLHPYL